MTQPKAIFSQEAEEAVVGAILINPGELQLLDLEAEHFYIRRLGCAWQAFRSLAAKGTEIDLVTVKDELDRMGKLEEVGGPAYLTGLINATPSSLAAEDYAGIVRDYARRRAWNNLASHIAKVAWDLDRDLEQEAPAIVDALIREIQTPGAAVHVNYFTRRVIERAVERMENPQDVWGIPTGYADLDRFTGGLQSGEILNVSGDPGVGKSILVDQMAFQIALCGTPGVIYSLEMPGEQVVRRRLSYAAKVAMREIKTGRFEPERLKDLERAVQDINALPLYMSDSVHWTTASLRADLVRLKAQRQIKWFVLDYAYLLQDGRGLSENDKTGLISAQLKGICRSLALAGVVILSQNKEGMREKSKTGVGIRGSGQQFYDADLILFLSETENEPHVITVTFGKGRELEESKKGFRLTRIPGFPALGDYTPVVSQYGRNGRKP